MPASRSNVPAPIQPPVPAETETLAGQRKRRLADRILEAFHCACDVGAIESAGALYERLEQELKRPPPLGIDRRQPVSLTGPHERLANLVLRQVMTDWDL
jgi:hypothetical protein